MSTSYKVQFLIKDVNSLNPFLYLACYDKKGNYYSSNYYNNQDTATRGSSANLTVENGCQILGVYVDYGVTPSVFYATTPMYVSNVSTLPMNIINLSTVSAPGDYTTTVDISSLTSGSVSLGLIKDVTTYVSPITANTSNVTQSDQADACISAGNVIIGDAAVTAITRTNGGYYTYHNICVSKSVIQAYKSTFSSGMSLIWILVLILIIVIIGVVAFVGYKVWKHHKATH